jgi:hypothetical protein
VTTRSERRLGTASFLALLVFGPLQAATQSTSQLAAWDALMLSPVGALEPVARHTGEWAPGASELALRYGRWRYDPDDAVHDNIGVTWSYGLGFAHAQLSFTGAYEMVECPTCNAWASGSIDLQSALWDHHFGSANRRPTRMGIGLRMSIGGAKYLGAEASTASSAAVTMPIDIELPLWRTSALGASIEPGFGFGHVASPDIGAGGFLPMIGAAISWTVTSRINVGVGAQRVIIDGGPTQVGAALSLKLGSVK